MILFVTAFNLSCQSTALEYCKTLDWRALGESAALSGSHQKDSFKENEQVCSKFKTPVDKLSFNEGYTRGLAQFCTTANGYDFGEKGLLYTKTCPLSSQASFLKGFYKGRLKHLSKELTSHQKLYSEAEDRLWRKEQEYLIIQNENPEQAKLEVDLMDAYREEARLLAQKKRMLRKEIVQTRKLSQESYF